MSSEAREEADMGTKVAPDNDKPDEKPDNNSQETVPYSKLFTYADNFDKLLMVIGTIGSMCNGAIFDRDSFFELLKSQEPVAQFLQEVHGRCLR
jgi:hypothetical protein